jgi:type IV secretion system protein VirB10
MSARDASGNSDTGATDIPGERGLPSVNAGPTVQARVTRFLTLALGAVLAAGLLTWYVRAAAGSATRATAAAQAATTAKAAGEMRVPPLGPLIRPPAVPPDPAAASDEAREDADDAQALDAEDIDEAADAWDAVLGPRPPPPQWRDYAPAEPAMNPSGAVAGLSQIPAADPPDRRLSGAVFVSPAGLEGGAAATSDATAPEASAATSRWGVARVTAERLPARRTLLPKGSFLDGTLETAIDTTLPGLVTAVLARDTYGADGSLVLLERGTRLLGEIERGLTRGQSRVRVIWQEARTPRGLVVPLASPGTDALGRSGMTGALDRHGGERFGAALLISVLDAALQAGVAAARSDGGDSLTVSPGASSDIATEVLKDTIAIPPTIRIAPGTPLQVLVAQDVDFAGVVESDVTRAR